MSLKVVTFILLTAIFLYRVTTNRYGLWSTGTIPWYLLCYSSGYLMYPFCQKLDQKFFSKKFLFLIAILLFAVHFVILFNVIVPYNDHYREQDDDVLSYLMRYGIACVGVAAIYFISKSLVNTWVCKMIEFCGRNSLVILCTHMLFFRISAYLDIPDIVYYSTSWLAVIPSIWLYNRYFNPMLITLKSKI